MPKNPDKKDPFEEEQQRRKEVALDALQIVVEKYSPAKDRHEADTFFGTSDICIAISEHTGVEIHPSEIFPLMKQMGYRAESFSELEMHWLLKKN